MSSFAQGETANLTSLGLSEGSAPAADIRVGFRTGWFRHIGVTLAGASGAAAVVGTIEVFKAEPAQAIALLQSWGPSFLLVLVALFLGGKFLDGLVTGMQTTVSENSKLLAGALTASAEASGRTADALTQLANQGNRQAEQVERLAIYAASEFPGVYDRFDRQDEVLKEMANSIKGVHSMLSNEKAALAKKEAGGA
jgi:hypothetical protein